METTDQQIEQFAAEYARISGHEVEVLLDLYWGELADAVQRGLTPAQYLAELEGVPGGPLTGAP